MRWKQIASFGKLISDIFQAVNKYTIPDAKETSQCPRSFFPFRPDIITIPEPTTKPPKGDGGGSIVVTPDGGPVIPVIPPGVGGGGAGWVGGGGGGVDTVLFPGGDGGTAVLVPGPPSAAGGAVVSALVASPPPLPASGPRAGAVVGTILGLMALASSMMWAFYRWVLLV